jgi:hypothetical protein
MREVCAAERMEALVVSSTQFVQPAVVRVEAWSPQSEPGTTARTGVVIEISAKQFHQYDIEYAVEISDCGKQKKYERLRSLTPNVCAELARFALGRREAPNLNGLRLREKSWQLWRPANKVTAIGLDPLSLIGSILIVVGVPLLALGGFGLLVMAAGAAVLFARRYRKAVVLSAGKPQAEPRSLRRMDSWQTVISGLGSEAAAVRTEFLALLSGPPITGLRSWSEDVWYWGLDGPVEREQIILVLRRAWLFVQVYDYDNELYIGWDAHLNAGQWVEKTVQTGVHRATHKLTKVNQVVPGVQVLTEYDVIDANSLLEWTHRQLVQIVKRLMDERKIDQEIDFQILREARAPLTAQPAEPLQKRLLRRVK